MFQIKRYDEDMKDIWIKEGYNIIHKQYNSISSNFKNYINLPVHIKCSSLNSRKLLIINILFTSRLIDIIKLIIVG